MRSNKNTFWLLAVGLLIGWVGYASFIAGGSQDLSAKPHVLGTRNSSSTFDVNVLPVKYYSLDQTTQTQRISFSVIIHNRTNATVQLSPGLQMSVIDSDGTVANVTAAFQPAGKILGGPLNANDTWNESLDFTIPANTTAQTFVFQNDAATEPIKVGL